MISLIVCSYNREKYIYEALSRIAKNDYPTEDYEIVMVNNNSTDNTANECKRFAKDYPQAPYHYFMETKQGLSHARNRGIDEAKGDIIVFLDDDSMVEPDYLKELDKAMKAHSDAMAYGGKITPRFENGETPKWICKWTYSWVSAIDMGNEVKLFERNAFPIGANMGFRKECLDKVGKFNPDLGRSKKNLMGGEEKDIFNRVKAEGMKIYYFPTIALHHVIPPSRTTPEYIKRMGYGVGLSELMRCKSLGKK